jgi:hypothetical protein
MRKKNGIVFLQTRIDQELKQIRKVVKRVEEKLAEVSLSSPDDFTIGGFANYVHSFYNGLENIFKLIAEYVDESQPQSAGWHRELLNQMSLELQDLRPAVLTAELASVLEDYLEFRHFFRHSYGFDLDWDELKPKAEKLKPTFEKLEAAFQQFFVFLQAASEHID